MTKSILWVALWGFVSFSCTKDHPEQKDLIKYIDLQPDIESNTIRDYYTSMNPFCGPLPLPNDSTVVIDLDLNNDSEADFNIEIRHYEQELTQYCGHCGIFHIKLIRVKPINANGFVSIDPVSNYWIRNYDSAQIISNTDSWTQQYVTALLKDGCLTPEFNFVDTYWGLKLDDMIAWIRVERLGNNGVRIKEYAYKTTNNSSILAGQKQ